MPPLSKSETRKDTAQVVVESGAAHVGRIANIVSNAVREVTREVGGFATEIFEIRDASKRAEADADPAAGSPQDADRG
ncbi:MAG: hypothetical protein ACXWZM_00900 [Solirubrobacterales bacterium]